MIKKYLFPLMMIGLLLAPFLAHAQTLSPTEQTRREYQQKEFQELQKRVTLPTRWDDPAWKNLNLSDSDKRILLPRDPSEVSAMSPAQQAEFYQTYVQGNPLREQAYQNIAKPGDPAAIEDRIRIRNEEMDRIQTEIDEKLSEIEKIQAERQGLSNEIDNQIASIKSDQEKIDQLIKKIDQGNAEMQKSQQEVAQDMEKYREKQTQLKDIQNQQKDIFAQQDQLTQKLGNLADAAEQDAANGMSQEKLREKYGAEFAKLQQEAEALKKSMNELSTQEKSLLQAMESDLEEINKKMAEIDKAQEDLEKDQAEAEDLLKNVQQKSDAARANNAQSKNLGGVATALNNAAQQQNQQAKNIWALNQQDITLKKGIQDETGKRTEADERILDDLKEILPNNVSNTNIFSYSKVTRNMQSVLGECFLCQFFSTFYQVIVKASFTIADGPGGLAQHTLTLMGIFLGIYILIKAGKILLPFGAQPQQELTEITIRLFWVMVAVIFLSNFGLVWEIIILPLFGFGLDTANYVMERTMQVSGQSLVTATHKTMNAGAGLSQQCAAGDFSAVMKLFDYTTITGTSATAETLTALEAGAGKIMCHLYNAQSIFSSGIYLGTEHFRVDDWNTLEASGMDIPSYAGLLTVAGWITGLIFAIAFAFPLFLFPFYLIGAFFRLAVTAMISPLLVGMAVFPALRNYAVTGIQQIMYAATTIIFQSLVIVLGMAFVKEGLRYALLEWLESRHIKWEMLTDVMQADYVTLTLTLFYAMEMGLRITIMDGSFYYVLSGAIISWWFMGQINKLAGEYVGTSASEMGGAVAGAVLGTGKSALSATAGILTGGLASVAVFGAKVGATAKDVGEKVVAGGKESKKDGGDKGKGGDA